MINYSILKIFPIAITLALSSPAIGQDILTASGGSIQTELTSSIIINEDSSLEREWIIINDSNIPATFKQAQGVTTIYQAERSRGDYRYRASYSILISEDIAAYEVRFLTFDIWGNHVRSLTSTNIADYEKDATISGTPQWRAPSESEVSEFYATIGYVAKVRTADGRVLTADTGPVLEQARRFSNKFSESDLDSAE